MRVYFDFYGDFSKYDKEDLCFGAIEFDCFNGEHYVIDVAGEVDYDFDTERLCGRVKGDYEIFEPEMNTKDTATLNLIVDYAISHIDTSTFHFYTFDDGVEPEYDRASFTIELGNRTIEFSIDKAAVEEAQKLGKYDISECEIRGQKYILTGTPLVYEDEVCDKVRECFETLAEIFGVELNEDDLLEPESEVTGVITDWFEKITDTKIVHGYEEY